MGVRLGRASARGEMMPQDKRLAGQKAGGRHTPKKSKRHYVGN